MALNPASALERQDQPVVLPAPRPRRAPLEVVGRELQLIVNARASGAGDAGDVLARATGALRAAGGRVHAKLTADEAELAAAVRGAGERRIVLVGGDGTVHALANLDLPALPPASLLPAGRANNIASALGIPVDWAAAAELAVRGRPAAVDVLHVATPERTLYAVEGVSGGFHAAARHRYRGENSADVAAGIRALVSELAAFRGHRLALRADGVVVAVDPS
jgi:diacylglycerol kinase family enzyme